MVRVISVHHFTSQSIQTIEQPTACTIAPPDKLLLALTSNCIEVRDLSHDSDVLFAFPSVDEVIQIVHCKNGNYVATLETKFNRQNRDTNFARVYLNWDSVATLQQSKMTSSGAPSLEATDCGMVQPMRARIAGRVTPTTNQSELGSLEMIEIPVKMNPTLVQCCQTSGNIAIVADSTVTIFKFCIKSHDISRQRFIDFDEMDLRLNLPFRPSQIEYCEKYIAIINQEAMYLCEMGAQLAETTPKSCFKSFSTDEALDFGEMVKKERHFGHPNLTIALPAISRENSLIHKNSPFTFTDKDMTATITPPHTITSLIQLRLIPILVENATKSINEEFKSLILKPIHLNSSIPSKGPSNQLYSLVCMVATQQEGYLYYFPENGGDACIAVYPFTAPIHHLVMEDYFVHALTEIGLETYTLRFGHRLAAQLEVIDDRTVACPPIEEPVCLVGLRPFLGVERLLVARGRLVLLANADVSPAHSASSGSSSNLAYWTIYNLELPTPKAVFNDISIVANVHRFSSGQTYCHLMGEAHVVLRVALLVRQDDGGCDDVAETYRVSCALLADHYIMCPGEEDYALALPYYKMGRVQPFEVMRRVKKIQEQSNNQSNKGLLFYLKHILLEVKQNYWELEKLFSTGGKQNFTENLMQLFETSNFEDLPHLILKSGVLRECSTDRLIQILAKNNVTNKIAEQKLALALLSLQKSANQQVRTHLSDISSAILENLLIKYWELLFETNSGGKKDKSTMNFSELAAILFEMEPEMLAKVLFRLITEKKVTLNRLIKVFLEYLPACVGNESNSASLVLQKTLEIYFQNGSTDPARMMHERGANEALKLLVRSYLSQLQLNQMKETFYQKKIAANLSNFDDCVEIADSKWYFDDTQPKKAEQYLFDGVRFEYLSRMPPFQLEITSKLYEASQENYQNGNGNADFRPNDAADLILRKLQAILSSQLVSKQIISEINAFLTVNEHLRGALSLKSLITPPVDGVALLIDVCPQCLLQFGKDRFSRTDEWKALIAGVQRCILRLGRSEALNRVCFFYKKLLKDVLTHVAVSMSLDQLVQVFPARMGLDSDGNREEWGLGEPELDLLNEIQNYEPFVVICKETMHANQINKLITTTGQQLLCTLNL